jgi:hypothetical protein
MKILKEYAQVFPEFSVWALKVFLLLGFLFGSFFAAVYFFENCAYFSTQYGNALVCGKSRLFHLLNGI